MQLAKLTADLSARDIEIVRILDEHRFLTTQHVEALIFTDHASKLSAARSCRRVLERLKRDRLLDTLERRVGGVRAGSASFIWHLTHTGQRLLAMLDGEGSARRFHEPSQRLLDHSLMVADIHVTIRHHAPAYDFELLRIEFEPDSWRSFTGLGGERRLVRPDLTILTATTDYEDHWFVEADTGSEHPPTVVRACKRYLDYFATGIEQEAHGVVPRVVWVVPHQMRADKLQEAFKRARLDRELFRVITIDDLPRAIAGGAS